MPNYITTQPPTALYPGDVVFPFNAESPAPPQASQQFALGFYQGATAEQGRTVVWQTSFAAAPSAVSVSLQAAEADADAQYQTIDTSTNVNGERRSVPQVNAKFLRARLASQTGGGAITVQLGV